MPVTYQTLIKEPVPYLNDMGKLFGMLERKLFVDSVVHNKPVKDIKRAYIQQYQITARQFNAINISLKGKVSSIKELQKLRLQDLTGRIKSTEKAVKKKEKSRLNILKQLKKLFPETPEWQQKIAKLQQIKHFLHQKKRRLRNLEHKLSKLKQQTANNSARDEYPSICFGGKKLFNAQHNLTADDFKDHSEWLKAWQGARSSNLLLVGSKDEIMGNQSCTYYPDNTLRIRVADKYQEQHSKYIKLPNITFSYGQEQLDLARKKNKAITYRFVQKSNKWYLHATIERDYPVPITNAWNGVIGVDLNDGFLQVAEIDRFGNPLKEFKLPALTKDRNTNQTEATLGDVVKEIVTYAKQKRKPLVIEKLNFTKKKQSLRETGTKYSRMLSGLTYAKFHTMITSKALREAVELRKINPFATSVTGQLKYMARYGLSSHGAAAVEIARRGLGFKLAQTVTSDVLKLPERKRTSKFNYWSRVARSLKNTNFKDRIALLYVS